MSKSPLESSFSNNERKIKPKWLVAFLALLGFGIGGGVFAANIGLGSSPIEFGQGVATVTACDSTMTLTPVSAYTSGEFKLKEIVIGGIDATTVNASTGVGCGTRVLTVKGLNSGATVIAEATYSVSATAATISATVTPTASPNATLVANLTIESN